MLEKWSNWKSFFEKTSFVGVKRFFSGENIAFLLPPSCYHFLRRDPDFSAIFDIFVASNFFYSLKTTGFALKT